MTTHDMLQAFAAKTGKAAAITIGHPAGPSISARGRDGVTHHIVIPIDDDGRQRAIDYLAELTS